MKYFFHLILMVFGVYLLVGMFNLVIYLVKGYNQLDAGLLQTIFQWPNYWWLNYQP